MQDKIKKFFYYFRKCVKRQFWALVCSAFGHKWPGTMVADLKCLRGCDYYNMSTYDIDKNKHIQVRDNYKGD